MTDDNMNDGRNGMAGGARLRTMNKAQERALEIEGISRHVWLDGSETISLEIDGFVAATVTNKTGEWVWSPVTSCGKSGEWVRTYMIRGLVALGTLVHGGNE